MERYYHNTTLNDPNKRLYAFISSEGDLLFKDELEGCAEVGIYPVAEIYVNEGLLDVCPIEEFEQKLRIAACEFLGINTI